MGRSLLLALAFAGAAAVGYAGTVAAGLHPLLGSLAAAALFLLARTGGAAAAERWGRHRQVALSGLTGERRRKFVSALVILGRDHPDVARAMIADLVGRAEGGGVVRAAWSRSCLRLVSHRRFGEGPAAPWAAVTSGAGRPSPHLERALLAPALPVDEAAAAAEAAVIDDRSLREVLAVRARLLETLIPAVGNPFHPFFARAERDLERMLGSRFVPFPRRRLAARARALDGDRPLPPREEAAVLLLATGREAVAAALLAPAEAAGSLSRRGRALRTAAAVLAFLREGGEVVVTPELFARRTREIFFLHTRDFGMTLDSPHAEGIGNGIHRLLGLLREKRRFVAAMAVLWARRPALAPVLAPLVRRVAAGAGESRPPASVPRFLRWWREEGRRVDGACRWNLRGLVLMGEGRAAEAEAEFEKALELDPTLEAAAFNLALARSAAGRGEEAEPSEPLRRLAESEGPGSRAWLLLGEFLERGGQGEEAEAVYRRVVGSRPMDAEGNLALGRLLLDQGRLEEAEEALRRALAAREDQPDAVVTLALVHLEAGRPAEAVPLLERAAETADGSRREEARYLLHVAYRDAEDHDRAMAALDAVPDRFLRRNEHLMEEVALYLEERLRFDRAQRLHERLREMRARRGEL